MPGRSAAVEQRNRPGDRAVKTSNGRPLRLSARETSHRGQRRSRNRALFSLLSSRSWNLLSDTGQDPFCLRKRSRLHVPPPATARYRNTKLQIMANSPLFCRGQNPFGA